MPESLADPALKQSAPKQPASPGALAFHGLALLHVAPPGRPCETPAVRYDLSLAEHHCYVLRTESNRISALLQQRTASGPPMRRRQTQPSLAASLRQSTPSAQHHLLVMTLGAGALGRIRRALASPAAAPLHCVSAPAARSAAPTSPCTRCTSCLCFSDCTTSAPKE